MNSSDTSDEHAPLLIARGLGRAVEGRWLWRSVDVTVAPGERLAITGPSGSGKTLLLRVLAGLDQPDEGEVELEGRAHADWSMPRYRARVAYLPQRPAMLEGSVEANLRRPFGLRLHRGRAFPSERARATLARLGRSDGFLHQPATELSGGEAQLVALLRVLLIEPRLLLLDEPSASLDDKTTAALEALVEAWLDEQPGRAVVWTSHRRSQLARVTQREVALAPLHADADEGRAAVP